jgi:tripartite-type tricarboxylate transporter receptor subunit TctC
MLGKTRQMWSTLLGLLALLGVADPADAQSWPNRPVKVIMATAAGSAPDVIARIVTDRLSQLWGQQVLILNRPGAGGLIAMQALASAERDNHTLYGRRHRRWWCCRKPIRSCRSTLRRTSSRSAWLANSRS